MTEQKIELGDLVKDTVTHMEGVVVCIIVWLQGCNRVGLQARKVKEDFTIPDIQYFDVTQVEVIEKQVVVSQNETPKPEAEAKKQDGGPRPGPARR